MQTIDLQPDMEEAIAQTATLLIEGFRQHWKTAWTDLDSALTEVRESFGEDRINRIAVDQSGKVLGWIGGIEQYDGKVWELHPLVVDAAHQGQGIGRSLVTDLAERAKERGGLTLWVGTDDEDDMTTLAGVNLYPNVLDHIARIQNLKGHPYEFYQKCGFVIMGVVPDANGLGKPDILMAKSLVRGGSRSRS
ncbi:GNAT family N-acetyltransferase [Leptolyngbya sp. FACHB-541]|uniref:GNAT family N-acetyltransferase n=1 Tax=Leptolyngbya sp. FACHB-541 TaxID=2692810 RepID=UPI001684B327|nr:GNAT family N-acetyltransferase [Leptolyngbya sp. FACHB-541]MBD2000800.1 GNAT family N-acetyltransferase [Leptolyngbya sp. FACHB-541]